MAKTSTIAVLVTVAGDGSSLTYTPPGSPFSNAVAPMGGPVPTALASGPNTIAVPTGAQAVIVVPPVASLVTKTLKGVSGDTGIGISATLPTTVSLAASTITFVITCSGPEIISLMWL